jgi:hypothetical protein
MGDIEEMDLAWYFDLTNYQQEKEERKNAQALDTAGL